jgi:hypothetical protein
MPQQMLSMRRFPLIAIIATLVLVSLARDRGAQAQTGRHLPVLAVDPSWPQLPEDWIFGVAAGISTDADDHVWIIHRPGMVTEKKVCCKPAPVVMEFDASGKLLQSWNGAGHGYEWPLQDDEHGIFVDHKNNSDRGRGANGNTENQILKSITTESSCCRSAVAARGPVATIPPISASQPTWPPTRGRTKSSSPTGTAIAA